jgi:hypothetical protein
MNSTDARPRASWIDGANASDYCRFPIQILPYAVFLPVEEAPGCGVAIGDFILDLQALESEELLSVGSRPTTRTSRHRRLQHGDRRSRWLRCHFWLGQGQPRFAARTHLGGREPLTLKAGEGRTFIEDGYELTLTGWAQGPDYRIGFGECVGRILPAATDFVARLAEGDVRD